MTRYCHGTSKCGRWKLLTLACLLTFPLVLVQVVPCSGTPRGLERRSGNCWQVSSMGRCLTSRGSITLGSLHRNGYCHVVINDHRFPVHRLVAWAFLGSPPSEATWQVNHLDGNRSNNQVSNLEWATHSENVQHSFTALGRQDCKHSQSFPVIINGTRYSSIAEAARRLGSFFSTVRSRCRRQATVDGCEYRFCSRDDGNLPGEEWKPMINPRTGKEVPGRMVSSQGRITFKNGKRSVGQKRNDGYLLTEISESSQRQTELVHRLVAYAFLGPPPTPEHKHVNHKDGNPSNNAVENLEWVTPAQNTKHRYAKQKGPLSNWKPVLSRARGSHDEWMHHPSLAKAADTLGLDPSLVSKCVRGKYRHTGGYEFRFETEEDKNQHLPGEVWRDVDVQAHLLERKLRQRR
eukprot:Skav210822  [mRNA]  locus=scaffold1597:298667:299881:- [translate_table: standard]